MAYCYCKNSLVNPIIYYDKGKCDIPDKIINLLKHYCEFSNMWEDFLIGVKLNNETYFEYVQFDGGYDFCYINDWYEGEKTVELFFVGRIGNFKTERVIK